MVGDYTEDFTEPQNCQIGGGHQPGTIQYAHLTKIIVVEYLLAGAKWRSVM